ncbi:MAG: NHL repeat-containing protein [Planctomycetota bacterium]|jgi:DNA-binding beta-propeller fold protein YncE
MPIQRSPIYPTRVSVAPDGRVFVSDARLGSVFIHDADMKLKQQLTGIAKPLGVAVDLQGRIFVGCDSADRVEVYDGEGALLRTIDDIPMPTDLALSAAGDLYVADTDSNLVRVYDLDGNQKYTLGTPSEGYEGLQEPVAVALASEVYVASRGDSKIHVFGLDGAFRRTIAGPTEKEGSFRITIHWKGKFARIQDLAVDTSGRIHALDCWLNNVQILDPDTGEFLASYGPETFDPEGDLLRVPLGMDLTATGDAIVANTHRKRLEVFQPPQ